jgi:hypothetical protein
MAVVLWYDQLDYAPRALWTFVTVPMFYLDVFNQCLWLHLLVKGSFRQGICSSQSEDAATGL